MVTFFLLICLFQLVEHNNERSISLFCNDMYTYICVRNFVFDFLFYTRRTNSLFCHKLISFSYMYRKMCTRANFFQKKVIINHSFVYFNLQEPDQKINIIYCIYQIEKKRAMFLIFIHIYLIESKTRIKFISLSLLHVAFLLLLFQLFLQYSPAVRYMVQLLISNQTLVQFIYNPKYYNFIYATCLYKKKNVTILKEYHRQWKFILKVFKVLTGGVREKNLSH